MTNRRSLLRQASADFQRYLQTILVPSMQSLLLDANARRLSLHRVFGANLFIAHAVDYVHAMRQAQGIKESRKEFVRRFDELFGVEGTRLSNRKFELIDAVNNAVKHIRLDPARYPELTQRYGSISFQSLFEEDGRVLCLLEGYRFDYVRVVLQPAYAALSGWEFEDEAEVWRFARGELVADVYTHEDALMSSDDPVDAIDQMIVANNPRCFHCDEGEDDCVCAEYVFEGERGEFVPRFRSDFDFHGVMARISGAYRPGD